MGLIWPQKKPTFCDKCKKIIYKNGNKDIFLEGSVHNLQSNWNSDFQENVLHKYYKNGGDSWFDTFMQKTLHFLGRPSFE